MKNFATWVLLLLIMVSSSFAQRKGTREIGGSASVWMTSGSDSTNTKVSFQVLWSNYLTQNNSLDLTPEVVMEFDGRYTQIDALLSLGFSQRLAFTTTFDPRNREAREKLANDNSSALIVGAGIGIWAANNPYVEDRVYVKPAYSLYITTRSRLSSLAFTRTMIRYSFIPGNELYGGPLSLLTLSFGISMFYRL